LPLYSFHRFKKRAHFKFWINPKAAIQFFSTDFNLLVFSWLNLRILILQFAQFLSLINQKIGWNQLISGLSFQSPEDSTWFLISSIYWIQSPKFIKIRFRFSKSWVPDLGCQIDSINFLRFKISRFLIPKFCFWTRFKFLISISEAA
jgi:hypothetical protein